MKSMHIKWYSLGTVLCIWIGLVGCPGWYAIGPKSCINDSICPPSYLCVRDEAQPSGVCVHSNEVTREPISVDTHQDASTPEPDVRDTTPDTSRPEKDHETLREQTSELQPEIQKDTQPNPVKFPIRLPNRPDLSPTHPCSQNPALCKLCSKYRLTHVLGRMHPGRISSIVSFIRGATPYILSGDTSGVLKLWSIGVLTSTNTHMLRATGIEHQTRITDISIHQNKILSVGEDGRVVYWDLDTSTHQLRYSAHASFKALKGGYPLHVAFDTRSQGQFFFVGTSTGKIYYVEIKNRNGSTILDLPNATIRQAIGTEKNLPISGLVVHPTRKLIYFSQGKQLYRWDYPSQNLLAPEIKTTGAHSRSISFPANITALTISPQSFIHTKKKPFDKTIVRGLVVGLQNGLYWALEEHARSQAVNYLKLFTSIPSPRSIRPKGAQDSVQDIAYNLQGTAFTLLGSGGVLYNQNVEFAAQALAAPFLSLKTFKKQIPASTTGQIYIGQSLTYAHNAPDASMSLLVGRTANIELWDTHIGFQSKPLLPMYTVKNKGTQTHIDQQSRWVFTLTEQDRTILRIRRRENFFPLRTLTWPKKLLAYSLSISPYQTPEKTYIVLGSQNGTLYFTQNVSTALKVEDFIALDASDGGLKHLQNITASTIHPNTSNLLAIGNARGTVSIWRLDYPNKTAILLRRLPASTSDNEAGTGVSQIRFDTQYPYVLAIGTGRGEIKVWDWNNPNPNVLKRTRLAPIDGHKNRGITGVQLWTLPNTISSYLLASTNKKAQKCTPGSECRLALWDWKNQQSYRYISQVTLKHSEEGINGLTVHPDRAWMATAGLHSIIVWKSSSPQVFTPTQKYNIPADFGEKYWNIRSFRQGFYLQSSQGMTHFWQCANHTP